MTRRKGDADLKDATDDAALVHAFLVEQEEIVTVDPNTVRCIECHDVLGQGLGCATCAAARLKANGPDEKTRAALAYRECGA